MSKILKQIFEDLRKEMPYKWKIQTCKYGKATLVAYIDARDVQNRLDEVVGPENWQNEFIAIDGDLYCKMGINIGALENKEDKWVYKMDTGTESFAEKTKGRVSDCGKRAAIQWGLGRFLYTLGVVHLKAKPYGTSGKEYPVTNEGKMLFNPQEITDYVNSLKNKNKKEPKEKIKKNDKNYDKVTSEPQYAKKEWSEKIIEEIKTLKVNDLQGSEALKKYLPEFNKKFNYDYKLISELNTDEKLRKLIDFVKDQDIPESL
jgi:hypothetical protein